MIAAIPSDISEEALTQGVEASADVILLLRSQPSAEPNEGRGVALHLLKHRNGSLATIPLHFLDHKAAFVEVVDSE